MADKRIVVIEDETAIREGLADALRFSGYEVIEAADGEEGLKAGLSGVGDLVLLDLMLPLRDGWSVLEELRKSRPGLPIIILTARGAEGDRVRGLLGGADDYVVKPFGVKELLARIGAVLRRSATRSDAPPGLVVAGVRINFARRAVSLPDGRVVALTEREAAILAYLAACRERAVSREELLERVWGISAKGAETRTVDMHVARLRAKLGEDGAASPLVTTVRGKGYRLADEVEEGP